MTKKGLLSLTISRRQAAQKATPQKRKQRLHVQRTEGKIDPVAADGRGLCMLLSLACIMLFLFMEGAAAVADYPLWDFLTGHLWYPRESRPNSASFL